MTKFFLPNIGQKIVERRVGIFSFPSCPPHFISPSLFHLFPISLLSCHTAWSPSAFTAAFLLYTYCCSCLPSLWLHLGTVVHCCYLNWFASFWFSHFGSFPAVPNPRDSPIDAFLIFFYAREWRGGRERGGLSSVVIDYNCRN